MAFNTIEEEITALLEKYFELRDDDNLLYATYLLGHGVSYIGVIDFYRNIDTYRQAYGIASIETVSRIRRKVQAQRMDLQPSEDAKRRKMEQQLSFIGFAKNY